MKIARPSVAQLAVLIITLSVSVVPAFCAAQATFVRPLAIGSQGSDVSALQQYLQTGGYFTYPQITGYFGSYTWRAVAAFQWAKGLEPVGYLGPKTRALLNAALSSPTEQNTTASSTPPINGPTTTPPIATSTQPCTAPAGLTCISGTSILQPTAPGNGYTPGFGGGGGTAVASPTSPTADTTPPTVSVTAPTASATVSGSSVILSANASDNVAVAGVTFKINGVTIGAEDTSFPYSVSWDSTATSSGSKSLVAVARDTSNNYATSSAEVFTVDNIPPIISSISSGVPLVTSATTTWTTDDAANSQLAYGLTAAYGSTTTLDPTLVTSHSVVLSGLTASTTYHYQVRSTDTAGNLATSTDQILATASPYSAQSQQFFARLATPPTTMRAQAYDAMITGLINAGVWSKLDGLYVFAATDAPTARTNLRSPSFGLTEVGTPTFATDAGYTGQNGAGTYLETGFDPTVGSPHFTQSSGSLFAWRNTNPSDDKGGIAGMYPNTFLLTDVVDAGNVFYAAASGGYAQVSKIASSTGMFEATRPSSTQTLAFFNGVPVNTLSANSTVLTAGKTMQFLNNGLGRNSGSNSQISAGGYGSNLSDADSRNLFTYVNNYLASIHGTSPPVQLGLSSDVVNDGANNYTPGLARLKDGRLLAVYCVGSGSSQQNGVIVYRTSSDNGAIWSSATTVASPASSHTYTDTSAIVLSDGTILISVSLQANDHSTADPIVIRGTVAGDLSISWGSPIAISSTGSNPDTTSYVLPLADGRLMLGFYIFTGANQGVRVVFSSDGGQTWGNETTVVTDSGTDVFNESNYVQLASGSIIGVLRNDSSTTGRKGYWLTSSTDEGATWAAPTQIFNNTVAASPGRPALSITPAGKLFLVGRFNDPSGAIEQAGYTLSADDGATWSTPVLYDDATNNLGTGNFSYGQYIYAQGFYDQTTQTLLYILGQGLFSAAEMIFQQFGLQ